MRLLVTGKTGQVVTALLEVGGAESIVVMTAGRPEFDLSDADGELALLADLQPDVIVSAAAYTAVDKAESEPELAERINVAGPAALARLAARLGVPIIHLSTDYVFDGEKQGPYLESDQTNPLGVYGATKLAGEQVIAAATENFVVLRTAWIYSPFGNNFLKTMLRLASTRAELRVVDDQRGTPTSAIDIARAVVLVARNLLAHPDDEDLRGVFHLTGAGEATWADFATEIFKSSANMGGPEAKVVPISTQEYPTAARRPANSLLDTSKLRLRHNISLPGWRHSTRETVRRLLAEGIYDRQEGAKS